MASPKGIRLGDDIATIAKQMDRLASNTGADAPRITLAPGFAGTIIGYAGKSHRIPEDGYAMAPYLAALNAVLESLGWSWVFVHTDPVLTLIRRDGSATAPPLRSIESIVGKEHVFVGDAECVDSAEDYIEVIRQLTKITDGSLAPKTMTCLERTDHRELSVADEKKTVTARLRGGTDMIDLDPLLRCLNRFITGRRKLYEVRAPGWGQELGVVFATKAEVDELDASGYREVAPARD